MAIKEGLCQNCGSLIQLDTSAEEHRCIFCWAENNPDFSQSLLQDPGDYEFPNEEIAQPTDTDRQAYLLNRMGQSHAAQAIQRSQPAPRKKKEDQISPAEKVRLMTRPIVEPSASRKSRLVMLAGIAAFALIFAAIFTPLFLRRTSRQDALADRMDVICPFPVTEEQISVERQNNSSLLVISPETVDQDTAQTVYENFSSEYADVYGISQEQARDRVEVEVLGPEGGYIVSSQGAAAREDG